MPRPVMEAPNGADIACVGGNALRFSMTEARDAAGEIRDTVREELRFIGKDVREWLPVVVMSRRQYLRAVEERLSEGAEIALMYG